MKLKTSTRSNKFEYLTAGEFAKEIGVHILTLKRWYDGGVFMPKKVNNRGHKFYTEAQVRMALKFKEKKKRKASGSKTDI